MSRNQAPPLGASRASLILTLSLLPLSSASAAPSPPQVPIFEADVRDDMRVAPTGGDGLGAPSDPQAGGPGHVIYLNYDGGTIGSGGNFESNSQNNTSWVCQSNFTPFGAGALQEASIQATRADWEAYGVTIVTTRPASGDYTMNMIGSASCGPNNSGVAPVDCNNQNKNDIVFTFANSNGIGADGVATINSQEIAHSFGLMHVNQPADIMNPVANGSNVAFLDECFTVTGNLNCGEQHAAECGSQTQQNSHQELLTLFGPAVPDAAPPSVSITSPADGEVFTAPAAFEVTADASDDQGIQELRIHIDGADQGNADNAAPYAWPVTGVPVGMYTFEVVAVDTAGNETTSQAVTIEVVEAGSDSGLPGDAEGGGEAGSGGSAEGGGTGGDAGSGAGSSASASGGTGGNGSGGNSSVGEGGSGESGDDDALPPGFGDETAEGCACRTQHAPGAPPLALALLVVLGLVRRRPR